LRPDALITLALLILANGLWADEGRSTRQVVKVTDTTGVPLPAAEIRIDRSTDSIHPILRADINGLFAAGLRPGSYDLEVRFPGFSSYKKPLHVEQSSEQFVTIPLTVASCSQCVAVEKLSVPQPGVPISTPLLSRLPAECRGHIDPKTSSVPVFFPGRRGVRYGVSLGANPFLRSPTPTVPLRIWIANTTDKTIDFGSCSMLQGKSITVWSNAEQTPLKRRSGERLVFRRHPDPCPGLRLCGCQRTLLRRNVQLSSWSLHCRSWGSGKG